MHLQIVFVSCDRCHW